MRPNPVPLAVQARIMDASVREPSCGDKQQWRFLLMDDRQVKARVGGLCRKGVTMAAVEAGESDVADVDNVGRGVH
jgi:nitroreductase